MGDPPPSKTRIRRHCGRLLGLFLGKNNLLILRNVVFVLNFQIISLEIIYIKFIHWSPMAANLEDEKISFVIASELLSVVESEFHFQSRIVIPADQ